MWYPKDITPDFCHEDLSLTICQAIELHNWLEDGFSMIQVHTHIEQNSHTIEKAQGMIRVETKFNQGRMRGKKPRLF